MARRGYQDSGYRDEASTEGQRPCAQEDWCLSPTLRRLDDGSFLREPALGYQPFCHRDRMLILGKLGELPSGYLRLRAEAAILRRSGSTLRMPYGPVVPLDEGMDALRREMARDLGTWHARVAAVPGLRLTRPQTPKVLGDGLIAVRDAARILSAHIDPLLSLQPGWMTRTAGFPPGRREDEPPGPAVSRLMGREGRDRTADWLPDQTCATARPRPGVAPDELIEEFADADAVRSGVDYLTVMLRGERETDGIGAGLGILRLHRLCMRLTGEVREQAEILDGIPCRREDCEDMALERAEPPADPSRPAMHSVCASCRDTMALEEYREWAGWYARWADGLELACRRCELDRHGECIYARCACKAGGHAADRAA